MNNLQLQSLDIIIFFSYFAIFVFIVFMAGRKKDGSATGFFIQQDKLPWYVIGFSMIASGVSSEQFLGTIGFAYSHGMSVANWEWATGPSILILVVLFIPFYLRKKIVTMPHFLEKRFDGRVRSLFALITILIYVFINLAGVLYSGGYALNKIFGANLYAGIWIFACVVAVFTIYGGMATVAWTNVFQACMLLGGGILIFIIGIMAIPGGLTEIIGTGERSHLILPASDADIPWTGLIALVLSTSIWYYCTNQNINQTTLGAKSEWHAKMGVIFAGGLWLLIPLADTFPGLVAYKLNPNLQNDEAYIFVTTTLLPIGARGFMFAVLCASIISALQAGINGVSTIFTFDVYNQFINKDATQKDLIKKGRIFAGGVLIIGALWAPTVMWFGHIFSYFQECWSFMAIPVAVTFVAGLLWKKVNAKSAFYTLILSFPMLLMPYFLRMLHVKMNVFNVAGIVLFLTIIYIIIVSLMTTPRGTEDDNMVWSVAYANDTQGNDEIIMPWYKSVTFWAIVMISGYIAVYAVFW